MRVREVNQLTAAWLRHGGRDPGVISGAGLWPLLAVLAASADEPGRTELSRAVGVPAGDCMMAAQQFLKGVADTDGVDAAVAMWAQAAARLNPDWVAQLPPGHVGELTGDPVTDQARLDEWARERTGGLVDRFPIDTDPELMLILATALALRTTWRRGFTDEPLTPKAGPWARQRLAGLQRTASDLDELRVVSTAAGELTFSRIEGDNGLDVHLVLGEEARSPADVLAAAVSSLDDPGAVRTGAQVLDSAASPAAPGVSVVRAQRRGLALSAVRFTVRSNHNLMEHAKLFGLETVSRADRGHFSPIGPVPLRVGEARQSAVAIFSATGFEAAAVTAIGMRMVSMPSLRERGLQVTYDRPFGFLAVHRATGLVLFAGWVGSAEPWKRDE